MTGPLLGATTPPKVYAAVMVNVIDGDTITCHVDMGLRGWEYDVWLHNRSIRLLDCNAREKDEPGGAQAREHLAGLLPSGTVINLTLHRPDLYSGRHLARVTMPDGRDLATVLIAEGWAAPWNGRNKKPVPPWPRPQDAATITKNWGDL